MMGDGWVSGMGFGMGEFGGIGVLVFALLALVVLAITFLALRRRNS